MNHFFLELCWCAIQAALLTGVVTLLVLVARAWLAGVVSDMISLAMTLLVALVLLSFVPLPSWVPANSPAGISPPQVANSLEQPPSSQSSQAQSVLPKLGNQTSLEPASSVSPASPPVWAQSLSQWWSEMGKVPAGMQGSGDSVAESNLSEGSARQASTYQFSWALLVGTVLCVFAGVGLVRLVVGLWAVYGLRKRATELDEPELTLTLLQLGKRLGITNPSAIKLLESSEISTAATIGWWRPSILLPSEWRQWNESERATTIAHELAHISTSDFAKNLVAQFALAINYFNPLVHWLGRELRVAQELGADAKASVVNGNRSDYLMTMAEMALKQDTTQLGWLAQPFLPTRRTFLRRIEMLKKKSGFPGANNRLAIWLARVAIVAAAVISLGFRLPDVGASNPTKSQLAMTSIQKESSRHPLADNKLAYVSDRAMVIGTVDLDALRELKWARTIEKQIADAGPVQFFLRIEDISFIALQVKDSHMGMVIHNRKPFFKDRRELETKSEKFLYRGNDCFDMGQGRCCFLPDDKTMVFSDSKEFLRSMIDSGKNGPTRSKWPKALESKMDRPIQVAVSQLGLENMDSAEGNLSSMMRGLFAPLWKETQFGVASLDAESSMINLDLAIQSKEGKADQVKATVSALVTLAQNFMSSDMPNQSSLVGADPKITQALFEKASELLNTVEVKSTQDMILVSGQLKFDEDVLNKTLEKFLTGARSAVGRTQVKNSLKQLSLAVLNFESAYQCLPRAAATWDKSNFRHSWRVVILPYLLHSDIYERYRFDEPWNSEHNRKVTSKMPEVYRHPSQPKDATETHYMVVVGNGTPFEGSGKKIGIGSITDGTSNTMLIAETTKSVHWAKPEDLTFEPGKMKGVIGSFNQKEFTAVRVDGSIVDVDLKANSESTIDHFIMRADGHVSELNKSRETNTGRLSDPVKSYIK